MTKSLTDIWKFFSPLLRPYRTNLGFILIFPVIWCLSETIAPYLIKLIIDNLALTSHEESSSLNFLILLGFFYAFMLFVLEFSIRACNYLWIKTSLKIRADIQNRTFELIQTQPIEFIYNQFAGDLINKHQNLTLGFEKTFKIFLYGFYPTLLSFFFALAFISFINLTFSIAFLCWFGCMNLLTFLYFNKSIAAAERQAQAHNHLIGYIGSFVCNAITMITFPRLLSEQTAFHQLLQKEIASTEKFEFLSFRADSWRSLASWVLLVSMIAFLVFGWRKTWITLGDFSFITAVCFYVRRTIWSAALQFSEFFKELGIIKEALLLLPSIPTTTKEAKEIHSAPIIEKVSLDFQGVYFGYTQDKMLFSNLNLYIPAGQKLGITGNSGVGKTSLSQLLLRLYEPMQGTIKLNEKDYKNYSLEALRGFFSYVPQNTSLFHCSIFENIAFGNPNAPENEVYEAAKICLCDEFITSLEKGYGTILGEGGYKISGGQRQRIALARAYLKKAPVFILDEALSGLEPGLEEELLECLNENLKEHTIILISHQKSALSKMERIITLRQGHTITDNFMNIITTEQEKLEAGSIIL